MEAPKTFFSYSRADSEFALKLATDLREANANVWLDQLDISPGMRWDAEVEKALHAAECMLVILSPKSIASNNVMDEISYALEEGKRVIPIIIKECTIPFRIKRLQHIDFTKNYDYAIKLLLKALGLEIKIAKNESSVPPLTSTFEEQQNKEEESLWHRANEEKNIDSYQEYLNKYPNGIYKTEASRALRILENLNNRNQKNQKEEVLWKTACDNNTITSYKEYLDKTELGLYKERANELIEKFENENLEKEEELTWQKANKGNSINAFEAYLQSYPKGKYTKDATAGIENLEAIMEEDFLWKNTLKENTYASYKAYLRQTRLGKHVEEAQSFIQKTEELERKEEENTFWNHVKQDNSIAGYREYRRKYPGGNYDEPALSAIRDFLEIEKEENLWNKVVKENSIFSYQTYLNESKLKKYFPEAEKLYEQRLEEAKSTGAIEFTPTKPIIKNLFCFKDVIIKTWETKLVNDQPIGDLIVNSNSIEFKNLKNFKPTDEWYKKYFHGNEYELKIADVLNIYFQDSSNEFYFNYMVIEFLKDNKPERLLFSIWRAFFRSSTKKMYSEIFNLYKGGKLPFVKKMQEIS